MLPGNYLLTTRGFLCLEKKDGDDMAKDNKQSNELFKKIATHHGVSVDNAVRDMQDMIDATWHNPDPEAWKRQQELFPNGKPSIEEFIRVMAKLV